MKDKMLRVRLTEEELAKLDYIVAYKNATFGLNTNRSIFIRDCILTMYSVILDNKDGDISAT